MVSPYPFSTRHESLISPGDHYRGTARARRKQQEQRSCFGVRWHGRRFAIARQKGCVFEPSTSVLERTHTSRPSHRAQLDHPGRPTRYPKAAAVPPHSKAASPLLCRPRRTRSSRRARKLRRGTGVHLDVTSSRFPPLNIHPDVTERIWRLHRRDRTLEVCSRASRLGDQTTERSPSPVLVAQ
jgi:hypothetical protein